MAGARFESEGRADPATGAEALMARGREWLRMAAVAEDGSDADALVQRAAMEFDAAVALEPENLGARLTRGALNETLGRYDDAVADYLAVSRTDPSADAFRKLGDIHHTVGDLEQAVRDYERALELHPEYTPALIGRGRVHGQRGEFDRAELDFSRAVELAPGDAEPLRWLGIARTAAGRPAEATADLEAVVAMETERGGPSAESLCRLAEARLALGEYERSEQEYTRALEADPSFRPALVGRSKARFAGRNDGGAVEDLSHALELDPSDIDARRRRGLALERMRRFDEALADYAQVVEASPTANDFRNLGDAHFALDDIDAAAAAYSRGRDADPSHTPALVGLARTCWRRGNLAAAVECFSQAVGFDPEDANLRAQRAEALDAIGDVEGAEDDLAAALDLDPNCQYAYVARGRSRMRQGRLDDAVHDLSRALELDPTDGYARRARGYVFELLDRYEEALADYETVIAAAPSAAALMDCAEVRRALGDLEGAIDAIDHALELEPANPWCHTARGDLRMRLGEHEAALDDLSAALAIDPDNVAARRLRGIAHDALGRTSAAFEDYDAVIDLQPTADAFCNRADAWLTIDEVDRAQSDFRRALTLEPENVRAHIGLGRASSRAGDLEAALADLGRAIELEPANVEARRLRASALEGLERPTEALSEYAAVADAMPGVTTYCDLGEANVAVGDPESAVEAYGRALELDSGDARARVGRGYAHALAGAYEAAAEDLTVAVALMPDVWVRRLRGIVLQNLHRWEDALADFDVNVESEPSAEAFTDRAETKFALGDVDGAYQDYARALECDPGYVAAYTGRAQLHAHADADEDACADYDAAISLDEANVDALIGRADTLVRIDELDEALWDYGRALEVDPDHVQALGARANAQNRIAERYRARLLEARMTEAFLASLEDIDRAIALTPAEASLYGDRAAVLIQLEGYDHAADSARRGLEVASGGMAVWLQNALGETLRLWGLEIDDQARLHEALEVLEAAGAAANDEDTTTDDVRAMIYESLGMTLVNLGNLAEGVGYLERAVDADPSNAWATAALGRALYLSQDWARAVEVFDMAPALQAGEEIDRWALVGRGLALHALGAMDEAARSLDSVLREECDSLGLVNRAVILQEFREIELCGRDLDTAVRIDPDSPRATNALAWFYVEVAPSDEHLGRALELARAAVESSSPIAERYEVLDTLGWVLHKTGRFDDALGPLREAVEFNPHKLLYRRHLQATEAMLATV